jgi:beta-mannanase
LAQEGIIVRLGGFFPPAPQAGVAPILQAERALGCRLDPVMWFRSWDDTPAGRFRPEQLAGLEDRDLVITWEPWRPADGKVQPGYAPAAIAAGRHDRYVRDWAQAVRDTGRVIHLRPMHEMNGTWYPWGSPDGPSHPADYLAAWRHIRALFAAEGAGNVRWIWSPNGADVPAGNRLEDYYPGDDQVDVLGCSAYNWGTTQPWSRWTSFRDLMAVPYRRLAALGPQPIWLCETGCTPRGGSKPAWVRGMFASAAAFPRLDAVLWFNIDKETDWRATEPAKVAAAFRAAGAAGAAGAPADGPAPAGEPAPGRFWSRRFRAWLD